MGRKNTQIAVQCDNPNCKQRDVPIWKHQYDFKRRAHHFHNYQCYWEWHVGENNEMYGRKGEKSPIFGDKNPMNIPELKAKHIKTVTSEEYKKKMADAQKGEKNGNWKGGKTPKDKKFTNSKRYQNWRKAVFKRDNYTCRKCNQSTEYLEAHHQYNFSSNYTLRLLVSNGITFCEDCHGEFHSIFGKSNNTPTQVMKFLMGVI